MPKKGYNKGSRKALSAMKKRYGAKRGTSIFYAKANKFKGRMRSRSMQKRANATYGKGSRLRRGHKKT